MSEEQTIVSKFSVYRRNPGHWDIHTPSSGRLFRIRGGPGHYVVIDERANRNPDSSCHDFKTVAACMAYICDELMHELIAAEGQEVTKIESWNVPRA